MPVHITIIMTVALACRQVAVIDMIGSADITRDHHTYTPYN